MAATVVVPHPTPQLVELASAIEQVSTRFPFSRLIDIRLTKKGGRVEVLFHPCYAPSMEIGTNLSFVGPVPPDQELAGMLAGAFQKIASAVLGTLPTKLTSNGKKT